MFSTQPFSTLTLGLDQTFKKLGSQDSGIQIQLFNLPPVMSTIDKSIYDQLRIFDQMLKLNQATTMNLLQGVDNVTERLGDINIILTKKTPKEDLTKKAKLEDSQPIDPFLEIRSTIDDKIINRIFGTQKYKYQLCLTEPFNKVLYKQRNFSLNVKLVNNEGQIINNTNRIPITFNAYHNEEDPQMIIDTRLKNPIFKGNNESQVHHGKGSMIKLQFKQVSSFYSNKGLFFIMYAKKQPIKHCIESYQEQFIDYLQIKPMVVRDIFVKAKKK